MEYSNVAIVRALDKVRGNNLYVHPDEIKELQFETFDLRNRKVYLVETLAVINALVDRGTLLLYGGHGGGKTTLAKYLGQILCGLSKDDIEKCILRGHPHLTEEKILGTLNFAQMLGKKEFNKEGRIDVEWNDFVFSKWKIIDELNRMSPTAQNILLSLLAESSVKYHNESRRLPNFSLFATMNPKDEGSFKMSLPFKDRFALALPITMPDYESLATIGREKDKSNKQDDLPYYLKGVRLSDLQEQAKSIDMTEDAELFINMIISGYRLCDRIAKEAHDNLNVDSGLCTKETQCRFNLKEKACCKILTPLSVRVKEDLYRYSKALAWFLGSKEVRVQHIEVLAPYMIWHRSKVSTTYINGLLNSQFEAKKFTVNIELESTKEIISLIKQEFISIKFLLNEFERVKRGSLSLEEFGEYVQKLKKITSEEEKANNSLILKKEIAPEVLNQYAPVYQEIIEFNKQIEQCSSLTALQEIKETLLYRYDIPNRQYLSDKVDKKKKWIGAGNINEYKATVSFNAIVNNAEFECHELYHKFFQKYNRSIEVDLHRRETLFDFDDHSFELKVEPILSAKDTSSYDVEFRFKGPDCHSIKQFLEIHNAG